MYAIRKTSQSWGIFRRFFSSKKDYDVVIIGGGPGGYVCSIRCGQHKLKVLNINEDKDLGGTCLNRGCIPSKSLLHISQHFYEAKHKFEEYGIQIQNNETKIHVPTVHKHKNQCMKNLTNGISFLYKKNHVEHIIGTGSIVDPNTVCIESDKGSKKVTTERIVIATGSVPIQMPLKKLNENEVDTAEQVEELIEYDHKIIQTSDDILNFQQIPKRLTIIGAGVIGIELGSVFSRLGSEVSVLEYNERLCAFLDPDMSKVLQKTLEKIKLQFLFNSVVVGANVRDNEATIFYKNTKTNEIKQIQSDMVLVCVGRKGNFNNLNLENFQIELNNRGKLEVDEYFNVKPYKSIKAIGDVTNGPMLAHKAEEEGYVLANILYSELKKNKRKKNHINYDLVPSVIYTHPEVASVGMNEEMCKSKNIQYKVASFPFAANSRARTINDADGMIKLLVEKNTNIVLGTQIIGNNASDLILPLSIYIANQGTTLSLGKIMYAHPTFSEVIKEVSLQAHDKAIHI